MNTHKTQKRDQNTHTPTHKAKYGRFIPGSHRTPACIISPLTARGRLDAWIPGLSCPNTHRPHAPPPAANRPPPACESYESRSRARRRRVGGLVKTGPPCPLPPFPPPPSSLFNSTLTTSLNTHARDLSSPQHRDGSEVPRGWVWVEGGWVRIGGLGGGQEGGNTCPLPTS